MSKLSSEPDRSNLLIDAIHVAPVSMAILDDKNYISKFSGTASREHFEALMGAADQYFFPEFLKLSVENGDLDTEGRSIEEFIENRLRTLREKPTTIERRSMGRWFETRSQPVGDGSVFFVSFDITERKTAQDQLRASQKLEAIGQMAGGIAHDFNNLLAIILGNLEIAREEFTDPRLGELLDPCIGATLRGAELTRDILSFARQAHLEPVSIDLSKLVDKTTTWMQRTLPASIQLTVKHQTADLKALVDEAGAENALINLLINARDAMPRGGQLTIETGYCDVDQPDNAPASERLAVGRYAMIAVSDTGSGIAPSDMPHIFEPFYSTKGPGEGSGLGLSMVHGFVRQSGGTVRVFSEVGVGTTFKLVFPLGAEPAGVEASDKERSVTKAQQSAKILVVEDEPDVLEIMVRSLTKAGFSVSSAHSGDQALSLFEELGPFDAVVTDIVMPGDLQGPALAQTLRADHPDLPIVFLSGYARETTEHGTGLTPQDTRLMKPVRRHDLVLAVQKALKPPTGRA